MLATTSSREALWVYALRFWWWRLWGRHQPAASAHRHQKPDPSLTARRFPIPASRAHLYARAADEGL